MLIVSIVNRELWQPIRFSHIEKKNKHHCNPSIKTKCLPYPQPVPQADIKFHPINPHLKTRICIFIVTRKDVTLLNVTSISEEDIIEICMTLGHTHPLGVLWYSAMELVALFHTTEEMQWASCGAIKAMELWDEPIAIWTMAPLEYHIMVHTYLAIVGGDPSKPCNLHPQRGRVNLIHPLETLTCTWGTPCITSRQSLATSQTKSCINLMEDLCQEIMHSASCMHPQQSSTNTLGRTIREWES